MKSDPLINAIAQVSREEEAENTRWEALARGDLSADQEAELREEAKRDPNIAAMYEAFRPLGELAEARMTKNILTQQAQHASGGLLPLVRRAAALVLPLAAAAAGLLWIARPARHQGGEISMAAPLPEYELVVSGGDRATRSAAPHAEPGAEATRELRRDSQLELALRPKTPVAGKVAARGFLVRGAEIHAWSPSFETSSDGAILVAGPAADLLGVDPGTWDILLVVGKPDSLPTDPEQVRLAVGHDATERPWQAFTTRIQLTNGR